MHEIKPIKMGEDITYVRDVDVRSYPNPMRPLFKDAQGKLWIGKTFKEEDDHVREYLGYHFLRFCGFDGVKIPEVRTTKHQGVPLIILEYFDNSIPYRIGPENITDLHNMLVDYSKNRGINISAGNSYEFAREFLNKTKHEDIPKRFIDIATWIDIYSRTGELPDIWRKPNKEQRQHVVACLVNDDCDRNFTNYKWDNGSLVVLDQSGGWENVRDNMEFGIAALNISQLILPGDSVETFNEGINSVRSMGKDRKFLDEIIEKAGVQNPDEKLEQILENIEHIEHTICYILQSISGGQQNPGYIRLFSNNLTPS